MLLVRRRDPHGRDPAAVLDSLVLTVGFALLFLVFLIAPNMHLSGLDWLAKSVSTAYPIGDVLLLAAIIRFAVQAGAKTPAFYFLLGSTTALLTTDCAYNYALLHDGYDHQVISTPGGSPTSFSGAPRRCTRRCATLEEPSVDARSRLTPARLGLLALACLIAPAIRFVEEYGNTDHLVIIGASAILFLLVVLRVAGLARQAERAAASELTLREAGQSLVGAVGRDGVAGEAATAAARIVGTGCKVGSSCGRPARLHVAASNGAGEWELAEEVAEWIQSCDAAVATVSPPEPVSAALGLGSDATTIVARLSVPSATRERS